MRGFPWKMSLVLLVAAVFPLQAFASVVLDEEEVIFTLDTSLGKDIYLIGDFNGWNPTIDKLIDLDGMHEIRLFLLPGRYRYRFIVDGVAMSDPGNPNRDEDGNSYFILREAATGYEIVYRESTGRGGVREDIDVQTKVRVAVTAMTDSSAVYLGAGIAGTIDDRLETDITIGYEFRTRYESDMQGDAYLVRGSALYRSGGRKINAFNRSEDLDLGDPLAIFGTIGPFGYPLGLFCRGIGFDGTLVFGVKCRAFYASRIDGYRTGLESLAGVHEAGMTPGLFSTRDLTDSDLIGLRAAGRWKHFAYKYLFRRDRRPSQASWELPADRWIYKGSETVCMQGLWVSLEGSKGVRLDAEFLNGTSYLSSLERMAPDGNEYSVFESDTEWEHGHRFHVGFTARSERTKFGISLRQETLEGCDALRGGIGAGRAGRVEIEGGLTLGDLALNVQAGVESYSSGNPGEVFWLQRRNFWLDGDILTIDRLLFLEESGVYDVRLEARWKGRGGRRGNGIRLTALYRGIPNGDDPVVAEVRLDAAIPLHERAALLCDLRFVSYRHGGWSGENDFLDTFLGLSGRIAGPLMCSIGVGVNPEAFDRWRYSFGDHGREDFLLARGVFDHVGGGDTAAIMHALQAAERELADEWAITFEAGIDF